MKLKGINPLEQHVEQIVLVTVSGIFLVVVAAQFLLEPNKVTVANATLPPGKAFDPVAQKAQVLRAQLNNTELEIPEVPPVNIADQFRERLQGPVAPRATLAAELGPKMKLDFTETVIQAGMQLVAVPQLPAPVPVAAASYRMTIDPTEALSNPELKKYLPAQQPMDMAAVSVEAKLDGQMIRSALGAGTDDAKAMPDVWWNYDKTWMMGVRLEREELVEPDQWSNLTEVPPPPGRVDGIMAAAKAGGGDPRDNAQANQEQIRRPSFYRVIAGPAWSPPSDALKASPEENPQVTRLLRARKAEVDRRERAQRALEQEAARPPGGGREQPPGGGGGPGRGGGGRGMAPPPPTPTQAPTTNTRRAQLERQIEEADKRIADIDEQLRALGVDENGTPLPGDPVEQESREGAAAQRSLLTDSSVRIWSHDLTVQPGKTYRYRVKVAINNPAFGRTASLLPEQHDLAKEPALWTEASEWTAPVTVPADRYYFITSASEASAFGPAGAQAEVYQFFYGYYRKGAVRLEPGDVLMATVRLPEASKLPIFDLTQPTPTGTAPGAPEAQPGGRPGAPGGRGMPGGREEMPGGQQQQAAAAMAANARPWDKPVVASEDVVLLDVARRPGENTIVAMLRGPGGQLVRRAPDEDPEGVYKLIAESAKAGENQGQPVVAPEPEGGPGPGRDPTGPGRTPPPAPPPPPPPSGGGGGAGGG